MNESISSKAWFFSLSEFLAEMPIDGDFSVVTLVWLKVVLL